MTSVEGIVRLGILGAGSFASRRHIPDALGSKNVLLTGLCRRDADARARLAHHFKLDDSVMYSSWEEMLDAAPMDAVIIATPNNLHYDMAVEAIERGLHVLLEKPMTIRSEDALKLVDLADEKKVHLAVAFNPPHWAHCHQIRKALKDPEIGQLESAAMYWTTQAGAAFKRGVASVNQPGIVVPPTEFRADPDQNGGGYFIDGGSHLVAALLWTTGLRAVQVTAIMDQLPTDMRASIIIKLENGAIATINCVGNSEFKGRRLRNVFGCQNGSITVVSFDFDTTVAVQGHEMRRFKEADLAPVPGPLASLVNTILAGTAPVSSCKLGLHVVEVVEAAYKSAATGKSVDICTRSSAVVSA